MFNIFSALQINSPTSFPEFTDDLGMTLSPDVLSESKNFLLLKNTYQHSENSNTYLATVDNNGNLIHIYNLDGYYTGLAYEFVEANDDYDYVVYVISDDNILKISQKNGIEKINESLESNVNLSSYSWTIQDNQIRV